MADADRSPMDSGENDIKEKFDFIQKVANLSPNILFVIDLQEKKVIFISKKVKELLGYDSEYFLNKGSDIFQIILHPDDYERRIDNLEKCKSLSGEEECEIEVRLRADENQWEWYRIKEKIFKQDQNGKVSHILGIAQNIHEQKLGEEKLQEEHRRLQNAQKIGHIGSFERELPGNLLKGSKEFFNILGIEPRQEGITLEEFYSYVHSEDLQPLIDAVDTTHTTGQPVDTLTRFVRPDQTIRHIHRRAAITYDDNGVPLRVYGTMQDITERVQAEKKRKRAEKLMRSTEILAGMGSYELDLKTNAAYFSDGLYHIFGEEPGAFTPSMEWVDKRSHPDDNSKVHDIINRAIDEKSNYTYIRRIYKKDGSLRILEAQGRIITNSRGEISRIIGLVQDITERRKAEEEIRKSEDKNRNLLRVLQNAPDSYLVLSPDFRIKMVSDAYLHATDTKRENITGKYIFDVFPDNPNLKEATSVKTLKTSLEKVLKTKKLDRLPILQYDVPNGKGGFVEKYWIPNNSPVLDSRGEVDYIIHRALDVTEVMNEKATFKGLVSESEMLKTSLEEIKLQAQQLKENRALLQSVFDASPNSIILYKTLYDQNGEPEDFEFFMVNEFNYLTLKLPRDLIGKRYSEFFPNVHPTGILDQFKNTAITGEPADFEVWYEGQGLQNWFHFRLAKLGDLLLATAEDITERKEAEKELLQLKEELTERATDKYRKIINSMDEAFCLLEIIRDDSGTCVDYRYLEANPVFEVQTGLKNVVGRTMNELVPNIEDHWKKIYGEVASTGVSIRFEDYSDAMERWFDVNAFRIDAPNEQHVAVMFKDITDRKEAEERKSFLLDLNDAVRPLEEPAKIQETAMQILGRHLEVSRAYYSEIFEDEDTLTERKGYVNNIEPLKGQVKISDFSPELHQQFKDGKTLVLEDLLKVYENDGKARNRVGASQVRAIIAVPLVRNGRLVAVVAVQQKNPRRWTSQEVTLVEEVCEQTWAAIEKAQAEKSLRESEQRFRNLVESSALAVWETEPDGTVKKDSTSWRDFTGQSYEEWIGKGWANAVHKEDRAYIESQWKKSITTQTKFDEEFRLVDFSGDSRWVSVKAIPILDIEGNVTKWSGMNIDIHDRKQAEEALIHAKEDAEAASRAKEDFLSTMSHEIRTPLNAVIGLTNLLLDRNPREDQKENLNSLHFSAKNLLALINDILDFSKLEAGKAELTITSFDLPGLLLNLKQAHQPLADDKKTKLELHIDKSIPDRIAADQLKLSQVLHNLVNNAVKFTANGTVSISVDLQQQNKDDLFLKFEIKDTGIGISEEKLEHIFEKFTQAESSTVRQYGGTGLGLSITRLLLELMGSEIKLHSTPGKGSRFYFSLPVKKAKLGAASPTFSITSENFKDLRNLKVLLVEDVEINRKIIIQFLENWWQLKPDEAKNGKEAIEMASKNHYDMILMDIRMPVMDGYEATYEIRKFSGYKDVPILALTADKNQEVEQADHETRFSGLLTKPFEPLDLKKKILLHLPVSNGEIENNEEQTSSKVPSELSSEKDSEGFKDEKEDPLFEISRYTEIAGENEEILKKLLSNSIKSLQLYQKEFTTAANEKNLVGLSDLVHKNTTSLHYLQANGLTKKINEFREILTNSDSDLEEKQKEILREFRSIIAGLEDLRK
ncbi:PAS domain S-box protein [Salinimicrobium terrae]|uniref:PAS domain S-box protein n=1 Tax=Salinimicrobium terrae TaxID=470866 RepID=UPI000687D632|nr:PAS domain S-box protein [Salinimicrobium terrae]